MATHTNIDATYLPVDVTPTNELTTYYESYVLIPNLGPLLYSRLYRELKAVVNDFAETLHNFDRTKDFYKEFDVIPSAPFVHHSIDDVVAVFNIAEAFETRVTTTPKETLTRLREVGNRNIAGTSIPKQTSAAEKKKLEAYKDILTKLAVDNRVMSSLAAENFILKDNEIVSKTFLEKSEADKVDEIVAVLAPGNSSSTTWATKITDKIIAGSKEAKLSRYKNKLVPLIARRLDKFLDNYRIQNIKDHTKVTESCEWAFLRKEKITMALQQPMYRGPLKVNSVAPNSELTISESFDTVSISARINMTQNVDGFKTYNSVTEEVKSKMGTLFDYGSGLGHSMSSQSYSQEDMKSQKRTRVESALREISDRNSTQVLSSTSSSSSALREYSTVGNDEKFATSELEFEVFTPVNVMHYLEDISAVWCPRVTNPFSALRNKLNEYYNQAYSDYVLENFVIDPVEPIESFESVTRVSKDTPNETKYEKTYTHTVTFSLTNSEKQSGYFFGDDIRLKFKQETGWNVNEYEADDYWMRIDRVTRLGDEEVEVQVSYETEDVWGDDPDWHRLEVSIDKYKLTDAYREELKQYRHTQEKINPARKNAVKAQARKYASLKREELIRKYDSNNDMLRDFAFVRLMKTMFQGDIGDHKWSYYRGILERCINWDKSHFDLEPCEIEGTYETELSPYHFLNVKALRFFLAINPGTEDIFFDTVKHIVDDEWRGLFETVKKYIDDQRSTFQNLSPSGREIDSYDSELILGRHLEAVLSKQAFLES